MSAPAFSSKVALVTGAGSGVGRAVALRFMAQGTTVVACDRDALAALRTARQTPLGALGLGLDVTDEAAVKAAVTRCVAELGCLDILVNCAGMHGPPGGPIEVDATAFAQTMAVNVQGMYHTCRHALPHLLARRGNIVNIASVAGLTGGGPPAIGPLAAYTSSQHAVIGLTRSIAYQHGADGVRANAVCPGAILTDTAPAPMDETGFDTVCQATPLGRWGTADEVAACVAFLAGDDASFVNGALLVVDGGSAVSQGPVHPRGPARCRIGAEADAMT